MDDPTPEPQAESNWMGRADFLSGVVFTVLGLTIAYLSWTMPRLEIRGIHPSTIPGLVPGLLGITLAVCGVIVAIKGILASRGNSGWGQFAALFVTPETRRLAVIAGLTLGFSLVLVGRVPFWLATGAFVFLTIIAFEVWMTDSPKPLGRSLIMAGVQATLTAAVIVAIFQYGFLVRLP